MTTAEENKTYKIYCDYKQFKGNTFEDNINKINDIYLGKYLKISNKQYIYYDEKDDKNYLSANYFIIKIKQKN